MKKSIINVKTFNECSVIKKKKRIPLKFKFFIKCPSKHLQQKRKEKAFKKCGAQIKLAWFDEVQYYLYHFKSF